MSVRYPRMVGQPWWRRRAEQLVDPVLGVVVGAVDDAATRMLAPWRPPPPLRAGDTVEWAGPARPGGVPPSGIPFEAMVPGMRGRVLRVEPLHRGWAAQVRWDDWEPNHTYGGPAESFRKVP